MSDRYYTLIGDAAANLPDRYVRITSHGFERWDGAWLPVTDKQARDYLVTKLENGDGIVPSTRTEIAALH